MGKINNNIKDSHKTTCGFGLFISNILCLLIENVGTEKKKGLTVYSEQGLGTCFSFSFRNDMGWETKKIIDKKVACSSTSIESKEIKDQIFFSIASSECKVDRAFLFNTNEQTSLFPHEKTDYSRFRRISSSHLFQKDPLKINESEHAIFRLPKRYPTQKIKEDNKFMRSLNRPSSEVLNHNINFRLINECKCSKILVVDDVPFNILACSKLLEKMKFLSDSANNGQDAVDKVTELLNFTIKNGDNSEKNEQRRNSKESKFCAKCKFYKLILMDVDMPIKNGIEATEEIKNLLKDTGISVSIVGLSAFDQDNIVDRGKEAGMCEYITKPINANKMKEIISKYVLKF